MRLKNLILAVLISCYALGFILRPNAPAAISTFLAERFGVPLGVLMILFISGAIVIVFGRHIPRIRDLPHPVRLVMGTFPLFLYAVAGVAFFFANETVSPSAILGHILSFVAIFCYADEAARNAGNYHE